jgi:serine protease Do
MKRLVAVLLGLALLPAFAAAVQAQNLDDLFRKVNPTVVVVKAKGRDVGAGGIIRFTETGSGVLISDSGRVMTASHVVNGMDEITVEGVAGEVVRAQIVSSVAAADVSLLQLERVTAAMRVAKIGDSDAVRVGQQVVVVGAPYGLSHSMSAGWISARWPPNSIFRDMPLAEFFQTTATINTGNSGGPMFDVGAEVIGIVSHNISKSGGSEGLGFVVTINTAKKLLLEKRSLWSGIDGIMLTGDLAAIFNVPQPAGFLVKTVAKASPAWDMGLLGSDKIATIAGQQMAVGGDIILTVDGIGAESGDSVEKIRERLASKPSGYSFVTRVLRAGQVVELTGQTH